MKLRDYLIFFRTPNLLMIVFIQSIIKFVLFPKFDLTTTLNNFQFLILVMSTVFIAMAGYIINDINDVKSDLINKPDQVFVGKKITIKQADWLFLIINFLGLLLGYYLSYSINKISFFAIFIMASLISYLYSIKLKKFIWFKNMIVAILVFLSIIVVALFDIVPATNTYNSQDQLIVFNIVLEISIFAFLLTMVREMVKDLEDVKGDKKSNVRTLPVVLGNNKTKFLAIVTGMVTLIAITYFSIFLYATDPYISYYLMVFVSLPLIYFLLKIYNTKSIIGFRKLSLLIKIIMLLGMLIVFLF